MNEKSRFEIENGCDFSTLNEQGRLAALRAWAHVGPLLIEESLKLALAIKQISAEVRSDLEQAKQAQSIDRLFAVFDGAYTRLTNAADDYAGNVKAIAMATGAEMQRCGLKPEKPITMQ